MRPQRRRHILHTSCIVLTSNVEAHITHLFACVHAKLARGNAKRDACGGLARVLTKSFAGDHHAWIPPFRHLFCFAFYIYDYKPQDFDVASAKTRNLQPSKHKPKRYIVNTPTSGRVRSQPDIMKAYLSIYVAASPRTKRENIERPTANREYGYIRMSVTIFQVSR
jgi:hypothetical protein